MGKGQRSKRSRYVREIARNCEVAEDIYNGKIKIKREHINKYAGEEFKKKKKKSKHPVTIDNKINMVIDNMNNEVAKIRKEVQEKHPDVYPKEETHVRATDEVVEETAENDIKVEENTPVGA